MKDLTAVPQGAVLLVGAGPGDPELLTIKALRAIQGAEVVVHDRLVSAEIMALVPAGTRRVDVGKLPGCHRVTQDRINATLIDLAAQGLRVVRLKGGDPLIFGRGGEEAEALRAAGHSVFIVPGITSAQGAAAVTGVPLTHRGLATSVRYVTGHRARDAALDLDWASLADPAATLVVYMGVGAIALIAERLIAQGRAADTPVLAVASATTPQEMRLMASLATLPQTAARLPPEAPALFIIGAVAGLYPEILSAEAALCQGAGIEAYA